MTLTLTLQELQQIVFEQQFYTKNAKKDSASSSWRQVNQLLLETLQELEEQGFIIYTLSAWRDQLVYLLTDWSYDLLRRQQIVLPDAVDHRKHENAVVQRQSSSVMPRSASSTALPLHRHKLTDVEIQILAAFSGSIDRPNTPSHKSSSSSSFSLIIQLIQRLALECSSAVVKQRGLSTTLMSNDSQLTVHFLMLSIEALVNLGQQNVNHFRRAQQQKHSKARRKSSVATLLQSSTSFDATTTSESQHTMLPFCLQNEEKLLLSAICCSLPTLASEPAQLAVQLYHRLNKLRITDGAAANQTNKSDCLTLANALLDRLEEKNESLSLPYLSQYDCLLDPALLFDAAAAPITVTATSGSSTGSKTNRSNVAGGDAAASYAMMYKRKYSVANLNAQQQQQLEFIKPSMIRCIPGGSSEEHAEVCRDLVLIMNEEKGCVAVYDYKRNRLTKQIYGIDRPKDVKFLDSDRCVILSNREMKIYSLKQGAQVGHLKGVMNQVAIN